jgi:hypothetical protein
VTLTDDANAGGPALTTGAQTFTITVSPVNDIPSFAKGLDQTVAEDAGAQSVLNWATAIDDGDADATQTLSFTVSNSNNALFSIQPAVASDGTLTYTPAADANGLATVSVTLTDDNTAGGAALTTSAQTFTITVTPVNDMPSFVKGPDQYVYENSDLHTESLWATAIKDGDPDQTQALTFNVSNNNSALFKVPPAISPVGTLTYTLAANTYGSAIVTVTLTDDATAGLPGALTTAEQTFTITVLPPTLVTDNGGCVFDRDPSVEERQFRLIMIPDVQNYPAMKVVSSNPGQFALNVFYFASGNPGDVVSLTLAVPYPFTTQGANPVKAYSSVSIEPSAEEFCAASFIPEDEATITEVSGVPFTADSYFCNSAGDPACFAKITVKVVIPDTPSKLIYVKAHLDYGWKGMANLAQGPDGAAVDYAQYKLGIILPIIPNYTSFVFAADDQDFTTIDGDSIASLHGFDVVENMNVFKRNPGIGGLVRTEGELVGDIQTYNPVQNATVVLKREGTAVADSVTTDEDGFYMISYKHKGKGTTYTATASAAGYETSAPVTLTLKGNAYFQVDFVLEED